MSIMYHARMLKEGDEHDIVRLAKQHHAASRYRYLPFVDEHVYKLCYACRTLPHYGCVVLEANTVVAGYAAMTIEQYLWSSITIARDLAVFVTPIARSLTGFRQLVQRVEQWAAEMHVHTIDLGISSSVDVGEINRLGKVYQRVGYEWHSEHYRKEIA